MIKLSQIESVLQDHFKISSLNIRSEAVSGGDIHACAAITLAGDAMLPMRLFAKCNSGLGARVLKTEFESLALMNKLMPNRYPQAILFDQIDQNAVLIMQFHNLTSLTASTAAASGRALVEQHKLSHGEYGWVNDNYIGLTPQSNHCTSNWCDFFREQRLLPMLSRAQTRGLSIASSVRIDGVISRLDAILSHNVVPSLVHGDLWSGNLGFDSDTSKPLLYDPAPYYGDREVDIAMSELFGRQPDSFYQAYQEVWPLENDYGQRRATYNLYHALNHVVIFGASYNGLVDNCLDQIEAANNLY